MRTHCLPILFLLFFSSQTTAQWQRLPTPGSTDLRAITQHTGYLFTGGADVYIYRSADAGQTWQGYSAVDTVSGFPYSFNSRQLVAQGSTLYSVGQYRIFKTEDNGDTWTHVLKFPDFVQLQRQPGSQFVATDTSFLLNLQGRIQRFRFSTGVLEDAFVPTSTEGPCLTLDRITSGLWVATEYGYIYKSADEGLTWTLMQHLPNSVRAAVATGDTLMAIGDYFANSSQLHRSLDGGQTWETREIAKLQYPLVRFFQGKLYAMPQLDSTKVLVSSDLGETWATFLKAATPPAIHDLTVLPNGTVLAAEKSGVLKTEDNGQRWQYSNVGLSPFGLERLVGREGLIWGFAAGLNHFSRDGGQHWQTPFLIDNVAHHPTAIPQYIRAFGDVVRHRGKWYATSLLGVSPPQAWGLHVSDGDLTRWTYQPATGNSSLLGRLLSAGNYLLTYNEQSCFYKYSFNGGLYFNFNTTANHGTCHEIIAHKDRFFGLDGQSGKVLTMDTLELDDEFQNFQWDTLGNGLPAVAFTKFAVSETRLVVFAPQKIAVSDDAGQHWQDITGNLPPSGAGIQSVALAGDTLMAIADQRILLSLGSSGAWADITGNFSEIPLNVVSDGQHFVVTGQQGGLYRIDLDNLQSIHLQGFVFHDENGNGLFDAGENGLSGALIQIGQTGFLTTNAAGAFEYQTFFADSVRVILPIPYGTVSPAVWYLPVQPNVSQQFAVQFQNSVHDLALTLTRTTDYRPGFENKIFATVRNHGTVATAGEVQVLVPKQADFLAANPAPATNIGDSVLVWQTGDLPLFGSWQAEILVKTKTGTALGTVVQDSGFVAITQADAFPEDNFFSETSLVIGSFDPNDKLVSPAVLSSVLLPHRPPMTYTIRFQNTGSATATHVRILDTLAMNFDASALQILAASHPMTWQLRGRTLEFFLENIQLPDSSANEPGSHGFVQFSLRPGRFVEIGEVLRNRAAIYFDFNAPVLTDYAELPVQKTVITKEIFLTLCPNQESYENIFYPTIATVTTLVPGQLVDTQQIVHVNWHPYLPPTQIHVETCPGDTLFGHVWHTPGNDVFYRTETSVNGCDSLLEYLVQINWDFHPILQQSLHPGESVWGIPCYSDTVLVFPGLTQQGCDSTVTVYVSMIVSSKSPDQPVFKGQLSPNPASDITHLSFENAKATMLDVWLESPDGRQVRRFAEKQWFAAGKNEWPLALEGLPPGIWLVAIREPGGSIFRLLLVRV